MGLIPEDIISQILDRSDIVEVVSAYIPLKRAGRDFKALCPFHNEKTPSFVVSQNKQIFHCFGCGAGGNAINFVMNQEHVTFPEAVKILADKAGVAIPDIPTEQPKALKERTLLKKVNEITLTYYRKNLLAGKTQASAQAREYLKRRGVSLETVKTLSIGLALDSWDALLSFFKKEGISAQLLERAGLVIAKENRDGYYDRFRNRIMFPIFDVKAECIAFGARTLDEDNPAKYINSPETEIYIKGRNLYGFHLAKTEVGREDSAILVEGYMDFIMPFQSGVKNVVATLGTALTTEQIRLLKRYTHNVTLLFDSDTAGESAMLRSIDLLIEEGMNIRVATLTDKDDPDSFIRKNGVEQFRQRVAQAESFFDYKLNSLISQYGEDTIEGRVQIAQGILPMINKFKSAIMRSEYVKRLSGVLSVSEDALRSELKMIQKGTSFRQGKTEARPQEDTQSEVSPVERVLLQLMLQENSFISLTKQALKITDFQSESIRRIVKEMYSLHDNGENTLNVSKLMSRIEDKEILKALSRLANTDEDLQGDKDKIYKDCVQRLVKNRLSFQRKKILHQMEIARRENDQTLMEKLTQEFNQLIKYNN